MQPVLAGCEASCKVATHEPLEFLELLDVVLDDVGADHIQLVQLGDGLAVVGDEGVVVLDQRRFCRIAMAFSLVASSSPGATDYWEV